MFPQNKDFIFTIFDDTDVSILENIKPVYDFLYSIGMLTTKSVWPLSCNDPNSWYYGSDSLQDPNYAEYIKELHKRGFEIGFHGATMESSTRDKTEHALNYFNDILSFYPKIYACHANNRENIYWGNQRFCFKIFGKLYQMLNRDILHYEGNNENSQYFWGDHCLKHIDYVRTFTFDNINLMNISKQLPYINKNLKYINACFFTSEANNVEEFNALLCMKNQEKLEKSHGVCIITTHFGKGFVEDGNLNETTKKLLTSLSKRNGWFVPVSTALDFLKATNQCKESISNFSLFLLEMKWFMHSIRRRLNKKQYKKTEIKYLQNKIQ